MNSLKGFVKKTKDWIDALADLDPSELETVNNLSQRPVGLRDTGGFNIPVDFVSRHEVSRLRRELAEAISAEKWADGFVMAIRIVALFGGAI